MDRDTMMLLGGLALAGLGAAALAWRLTQGSPLLVRAVVRVVGVGLFLLPVAMAVLLSLEYRTYSEVSSRPNSPDAAREARIKEAAAKAAAEAEANRQAAEKEATLAAEAARRQAAEAEAEASRRGAPEQKSAEVAQPQGERPAAPPQIPEPAAPEVTAQAPQVDRPAPASAPESPAAAPPGEPATPSVGASQPPAAGAPTDAGQPTDSAATGAQPPPQRRSRSITAAPPSTPPGGGDSVSAGSPAAEAPVPGGAAPPEADYTVVPVYYGTDRARADLEKRIAYDGNRGRRLELGQALVTVPRNHVEPLVERPWALTIPFLNVTVYQEAEDPKRHFTMQELKALSREEVLALVKARLAASSRFKDHAIVFVHGYQTTFDNAVYRTAQIAYDLEFDGAPFLYSWPSAGTLLGYTYDRESAGQSERYLRDFLKMVMTQTGATKISVIAHSMGNQPTLRVLQDLKRELPDGLLLSQLILAAPDVDRDNFENIVDQVKDVAGGVTLYAAANDQALIVSRQVNGAPRAGDVPDGLPIIMPGIDTIDATAASMDSLGINHSGYAENNALLDDIKVLIASGLRPPHLRQPSLQEVQMGNGTFWRFIANGPLKPTSP
ncbi:MAG: alpha/beta hydrolase [Hyphomicrobiaceae bacterium]|nr:alpha/beta hydrolase [Hyphomicrobiaceae bacterium]